MDHHHHHHHPSACCFTASYSVKLLLLMVPLFLISVLVSVFGTKSSVSVQISPSSTSTLPPSPSRMVMADSRAEDTQNAVIISDEISLNKSSSSFPDVEFGPNKTSPVSNGTEEGDQDQIGLIPLMNITSNKDEGNCSVKVSGKRVLSNLEKIEAKLQRARVAIKEALSSVGDHQPPDPDYTPLGPMYWDAKVFHRSYLEMEKQFKIFVYKEGEPPVFHDGPCKSIYSMEGNFIHQMETDRQFRTDDPNRAYVFYLPFSVVKMVRFVYERDSHNFGPIRSTVNDYINLVARKYPFWNRTAGADHFILSCHDWGPEASFSHRFLGQNSIRALCNANMSEKFKPTKDVSIPEINLQTGSLSGLIGGPSPSQRPILAFFAGGLHGPVRPILLQHWEGKDEDIQVHKYLPRNGVSYRDMMRRSKFCICPSGYEVASPRIVEAIYAGCVPVLINVGYVPPFSDVLNWRAFSVVVSVEDIPNLKKILTGISSRQYIRMQRRVLKVQRHFAFNSPPKRFDVFHMILHSIWLRRLNIRIREL